MGVNKAALKAPSGMLKIAALALTLVVLIIARTGFNDGATTWEIAGIDVDHRWLTITTVGGYTIILTAIILTYLLGDAVPVKLELIFMFTGAVLFVATGALVVERFESHPATSNKDTGLALGSLAIINGIVMLVDSLLLGKIVMGK